MAEKVIIPVEDVIVDSRVRDWCKLPYPGHPHGCPNYGIRENCPPKASLFDDLLEPPFFIVAVPFDLEAQINRMKMRHPDWSDRQARRPQYWQRRVMKELREEAYSLVSKLGKGYMVLEAPEANGVDVFKTCENAGLKLRRDYKKIVWKVMIVGKRKKSK